MTILVAGAVGLVVMLLVFALAEARNYRMSFSRMQRLLNYSQLDKQALEQRQMKQGVSGYLFRLNKYFSKKTWGKGFISRAEIAGLAITPLQWLMYIAASATFLSLISLAFIPFWPIAIVIGPAMSLWLSRLLVVSREANRRKKFEQELPEFLSLISSSLRSGLSLTQSLEAVGQQGNGEVERQIRRATSEISLGMSPNDALTELAVRMQSTDMRWVNVAIAIQREVGGNLSVILDSVAETIRDRADIKREVETLSSESRLSAWILFALPVAVFIFFFFFRREYVEFFWTTTPGALMLAALVLLVSVGAIWMRAIIRIKV